jgi:O-antigen chain-terminating methyltransferase
MTKITDSEIDVEQLMKEIRERVALREAEGHGSLIGASLELFDIFATIDAAADEEAEGIEPGKNAEQVELLPLKLQPEFIPHEDDHYHINDLLKYHDHIFVWNAYRAILKREPDETGLTQFLEKLRSGRFNKIDILASLRFSPEGEARHVQLDGLPRRPVLRRLYRVPVFGYLLEMMVAVARLPMTIRSQRQFENHTLAQQELLAAHVNQLGETVFQVMDSYSRELERGLSEVSQVSAKVSEEQKKLARLQHQQVAGLFLEQREVVERLQKLKDELNARLVNLQGTASNLSLPHQAAGGKTSAEETRARMDEFFASFAEEFRGKREEIKEGLRFYLPLLKEAGIENDILDIGCGRGEWLELLKEEGFAGRGVEINRVLIEQLRNVGLEVMEEDALSYLRSLPDESLAAVTAFHFIEHLSFETLIEVLDEIAGALRPGGLVIFETPNPKNLVVGACNFYSDPTHVKPLFPETIRFILSNRGFTDVSIEYVNPVGGSPFKDESESSQALDSWFYSPRDFAVIGRKPASRL